MLIPALKEMVSRSSIRLDSVITITIIHVLYNANTRQTKDFIKFLGLVAILCVGMSNQGELQSELG